jgi:hypothetical protein
MWHHTADSRTAAKKYKVVAFRTNDLSGVRIVDVLTGNPLPMEGSFRDDGKPDLLRFYYRGQEVFDLNLSSNGSPRYIAYFYGPGRSVTWWVDRGGSGSFTERVI